MTRRGKIGGTGTVPTTVTLNPTQLNLLGGTRGEAYARRTDPYTSHLAAKSIGETQLRESQQAVLSLLLRLGAATDEEIAENYTGPPRQSPSGLRTRRKELVDGGYIRDTGRRKRLVSGRLSIVWCVA